MSQCNLYLLLVVIVRLVGTQTKLMSLEKSTVCNRNKLLNEAEWYVLKCFYVKLCHTAHAPLLPFTGGAFLQCADLEHSN